MYDVTWCGGISEAKKISDMADTYKIPTAPHTGGGPILWYASIHTATSLTNFYILESVYHLYNDVYPHFLKNVPVPVNGYVMLPETPGLGIEIREEAFRSGDAVVGTVGEVEYEFGVNRYRVLLSRGRDGFVVFVPDEPQMNLTCAAFREAGLRAM